MSATDIQKELEALLQMGNKLEAKAAVKAPKREKLTLKESMRKRLDAAFEAGSLGDTPQEILRIIRVTRCECGAEHKTLVGLQGLYEVVSAKDGSKWLKAREETKQSLVQYGKLPVSEQLVEESVLECSVCGL